MSMLGHTIMIGSELLLLGLAAIGSFTTLFYCLKLAWGCWCGFKVYVLSEIWQVDLKTFGQWAVVTGATSGIGKAYVNELARRGLDVILISRTNDRLQVVAKEIERDFGRKTLTIQADFTEGCGIYPSIAEKLRGLEIGILVNNVGMTYSDHFDYFLGIPKPEEKITELINCNVLSVTQMTRLVLPHMIERGKGLVINISSEAGARPQPLLSLYSATKIFVTYFSRCLNSEYKSQGIVVQCVAPFMVSTNMTQNTPVNLLVKSAPDFATKALNTVGHSSFTCGCISHALQNIALSIFLPDWIRLSSYCVERFARIEKDVLLANGRRERTDIKKD